MMRIYEFKDFPNPRRVRVFLAEKRIDGVSFEQVDVPGGEHKQAPFLTKNPYGSVPLLELDDGSTIAETVAICRYFEERQPEPRLLGGTPEAKARIEMWQRRVEQTLFDTAAGYFHHATPGLGALEPYQNRAWGEHDRELFLAALGKLDDRLAARPFIAGDDFSIADITALCAVGYGRFAAIEMPGELANLQRWYDAVSGRPSAGA